MSSDRDILTARLRAILLKDWDPSDVARSEYATASYDACIQPLIDLIEKNGADEHAVVDFLHEREQEMMCFPAIGKQRLYRVARMLMAACQTP